MLAPERMAQNAHSNRIDLTMTWDVAQTTVISDTMVAELCPDCTAAAKAVKPGFLP